MEDEKPAETDETNQAKDKKKKKKKKKAVDDKPKEEDEQVVEEEPVDKKAVSTENDEEEKQDPPGKKTKKKNKSKINDQLEVDDGAPTEAADHAAEGGQKRKLQSGDDSLSQPKKKKRFDKHNKHRTPEGPAANVSDSRLRAFGINPRKFHNKIKYGGKNNQESTESRQNGGHEKQKKNFGNRNQKFKKNGWKK